MANPQMGRCDVICCSYLRWDSTYHRPQHLMARAARDRRVFYVEEPIYADGPPHLSMRRTTEGVLVVTPTLPRDTEPARMPDLQRGLLDHLVAHQHLRDFVLWHASPLSLAHTSHLDPLAIVYDAMDDLGALAGAPDELAAFEELLLASSDVVFTAGPSLHGALRARHPNVHLVPSAVDAGHFIPARRLSTREQPPPDQAAIRAPRVGFAGVIDRRVDFELLAGLADLRPDLSVVLIGPMSNATAATLPRRPNVHWLGVKSYEELPYYLAGWCASLLPYRRDDSTQRLPASGLPALLAAGRAVIGTSLPDLLQPFRALGLVRIADTPRELSDAIDAVRVEPARDRNRRADRWLAQVSWDRTWETMDCAIDAAVAARTATRYGRRAAR